MQKPGAVSRPGATSELNFPNTLMGAIASSSQSPFSMACPRQDVVPRLRATVIERSRRDRHALRDRVCRDRPRAFPPAAAGSIRSPARPETPSSRMGRHSLWFRTPRATYRHSISDPPGRSPPRRSPAPPSSRRARASPDRGFDETFFASHCLNPFSARSAAASWRSRTLCAASTAFSSVCASRQSLPHTLSRRSASVAVRRALRSASSAAS